MEIKYEIRHRKLIYLYSLNVERKIKEKETGNCRWEKMGKAIEENELTVLIKILLWAFNIYWKFMCMDENNDKNKAKLNLFPL